MGYYTRLHGNSSGAGGSGSPGYWGYGNKDKIVKAAGNISALIENSPPEYRKNTYNALFYNCQKLEDISGLTFTEVGNWGRNFLASAFASHELAPGSALKTVPATLLPTGLTYFWGFLNNAFEYSGLETIPENFLPNNMPNDENSFLSRTFKDSEVRAIPANFIPSGITRAGNAFLQETFSGCNIESIPNNFLPNITSVGDYFLAEAFSRNERLRTLPTNFFPRNLISMGEWFFKNVFSDTGITAVPEGFIPGDQLPELKNYFLYSAFSNCEDLESVDIRSFKDYTAEDFGSTGLLMYAFVGCSSLRTLKLSSYVYNGTYPFYSMLGDGMDGAGNNLEIYIYGDNVLEYQEPDWAPMFYTIDSYISKVYVKASLVDDYKASSSYALESYGDYDVGIDPDKFVALP
jgi:hypothetical protein